MSQNKNSKIVQRNISRIDFTRRELFHLRDAVSVVVNRMRDKRLLEKAKFNRDLDDSTLEVLRTHEKMLSKINEAIKKYV